jgi:putative ABC transport system ATP-binding protein
MLLCLNDVSKRFEGASRARVALQDVSLEVARGQMVGVFGPSGCGKTTLLRIAAGLVAPDRGAVLYDGERLDGMSSAERMRLRRREIACVWADPARERMNVLDHVALPLLVDGRDGRAALRRAQEALLACEAEHCAQAELDELSAGEMQRVSIARALVIEPRLLLADSPAGRLSMVEQEAIMALLAALAREARVAVLIADSDAETLIRADPILYLSEGRLIGGTHSGQGGRVYQFPGRASLAAADG